MPSGGFVFPLARETARAVSCRCLLPVPQEAVQRAKELEERVNSLTGMSQAAKAVLLKQYTVRTWYR